MESFDKLPICAIVNGKFLAVHGGLSPDVLEVLDINRVNRFMEVPENGALCDFLWSDPTEHPSGIMSSPFEYNDSRGCAFYFGLDSTRQFLETNKLLTVIRAHEVEFEGFKGFDWGNSLFPLVITVFSAPNYCGFHGNKGAVLRIKVYKLIKA